MKRHCIALASLLLCACARAAEPMLTHAWRAEATRPAEVAITIRQGETLRLACTLLERAKAIVPAADATARFFWRDADAKGDYWAAEATLSGNTLSFDWGPACDAGAKRYDFVLALESPTAGKLYRAAGVLIMQPSPGFDPATLEAPDRLAAVVERTTAEVKAWAEGTLSTQEALDAEAEAREEADGAITEAVNAQAGVLTQHQSYLSTLSTNYNNLASSYIQSVTDLQKHDAALESALAGKADASHTHAIADTDGLQAALDAKAAASTLSAHANTWATGSAGGHVKLGTNSILATADGNFGVVGKTSGNQLIYRIDATPTAGSSLPVKSGGIYTALASKAALSHTHSQYLTSFTESDPTISAWAKAAAKPTYNWTEILNKPTTFPPATHNHDGTYLKLTGGTVTGNVTFGEDKESSSAARADLVLIQDNSASNLGGRLIFKEEGWLDQAAMFATWASTGGQGDSNRFNIGTATGGTGTTLATTFTPRLSILFSSGNVGIGTNSPNEKLHVSGNVRANAFNEGGVLLSNKYAAKAHSHAINEVTNLQVALDAKAPATHTHAMADTTGLQAALEALAPLSSVTCTTNDVTYIWQWDEAAGTFALRASEQ